MKQTIFLLSLFVAFAMHTAAQPAETNAIDTTENSHFKASFIYTTDNVWQGRKNDAVQPYITPTITYLHKSGLYVDAGLGVIPYNGAGLDLVILEGGYDKDLSNQFSLSLYGGKYFYASKSESVRSASGGSVSAGISYSPKNDLFMLTETGGLNFAQKTDYSSFTELTHPFYLGGNGQYSISPEVAMNIGTQNYYSSYIQNLPSKRLKKRNQVVTNTSKITVNGASTFQVLDYEFSCPLGYEAKKWGLVVTPYYTVPEGAVSYRVTPTSKLLKEELTNSFYAQVEAFVKF